MNGGVIDIPWSLLVISFSTLTIPLFIDRYFRLNIRRDIIISIARMTVQLLLVGVYLEYLFRINNALINTAWLLIMTLVGASSIISKAELPHKKLLYPVTTSLLLSLAPIMALLCVVIIKPTPIYNAQYIIPLAGMLLGNSLSGNIVALQNLFTSIDSRRGEYEAAIALGASAQFATQSFVSDAIRKSLAPTLASMTTTGIVTLPGMMTGQILGGASPIIAIKYQLLIMIAIFVVLSTSLSLTLTLTIRNCITKEGKILVNFRPQ